MMDETPATHNTPALSVSELSAAIKRTLEGNFEYVRVRGEISGCKRAASGHLYVDIKDDKALINAVCWRGVLAQFPFTPENGMEVICTGRISTYAGRSNYQLIIERMELAGAGALAALLEKRKAAFIAEGLFEASRKLPLPYLPTVIGVVTSPTGAVIRDILHRLNDRCPVHVLVWPTPVQGKGADMQVAEAIEGFNTFNGIDTPPRPDVLIVARGGGSLEDLWTFNEESVVRAAAASTIPLISAIGHETDTTLLDFVASKRAPTPTAAAEMAVPVIADLWATLSAYESRLHAAMQRHLSWRAERITAISRGLINPERALEMRVQRLDEWGERFERAMTGKLEREEQRLVRNTLQGYARILSQRLHGMEEKVERASNLLNATMQRRIERLHTRLEGIERLLEVLSHQRVLQRGYAYVTHKDALIPSAHALHTAKLSSVQVHFHDGEVTLHTAFSSPSSPHNAPKKKNTSSTQGQLL
jgi:exodeoxyribonuclease VII large subunit